MSEPQPLPPQQPDRPGANGEDERLVKLRRLHEELIQLNTQLAYLHLMLRLKTGQRD